MAGRGRDRLRRSAAYPRPRITVPVLTPWLSSLWIGLVTPIDSGIARPLIESLAVATVVDDSEPMRHFDLDPVGLDEAIRRALAGTPNR